MFLLFYLSAVHVISGLIGEGHRREDISGCEQTQRRTEDLCSNSIVLGLLWKGFRLALSQPGALTARQGAAPLIHLSILKQNKHVITPFSVLQRRLHHHKHCRSQNIYFPTVLVWADTTKWLTVSHLPSIPIKNTRVSFLPLRKSVWVCDLITSEWVDPTLPLVIQLNCDRTKRKHKKESTPTSVLCCVTLPLLYAPAGKGCRMAAPQSMTDWTAHTENWGDRWRQWFDALIWTCSFVTLI